MKPENEEKIKEIAREHGWPESEFLAEVNRLLKNYGYFEEGALAQAQKHYARKFGMVKPEPARKPALSEPKLNPIKQYQKGMDDAQKFEKEGGPTPQKTAFDKLMELTDGGDYLEVFGGAGHGKSRLLAHIALEAKKAEKRVIFLDSEHSIPKRIQTELGDSYKRLGFMDLDKIINEIANLPKGYNLVCYDSVGFPVLIQFSNMRMRERGDAIMKTILLRGYLKDYAENGKALALGANQPKSELWGAGRDIDKEELEERTPPVGGKSIHVAKGVIRMSIERQNEKETMFGLRAFECQDLPFNKLLATFTINEQGEKLEWKI